MRRTRRIARKAAALGNGAVHAKTGFAQRALVKDVLATRDGVKVAPAALCIAKRAWTFCRFGEDCAPMDNERLNLALTGAGSSQRRHEYIERVRPVRKRIRHGEQHSSLWGLTPLRLSYIRKSLRALQPRPDSGPMNPRTARAKLEEKE